MKEMEYGTPRRRSGFAAFLIGGLLGGTLALLYAPQSGRKTREFLVTEGQETAERVMQSIREAQDSILASIEDAQVRLDALNKDAKDRLQRLREIALNT